MIRTYEPKDREACLHIFSSNCPLYFDKSEYKDFEVWLNAQDTKSLAYGNTKVEKYYVIEKEDKIVGCGGYYIVSDSLKASTAWGMIHCDYHKQGLGKQLFEFRLEEIKKTFPNHQILLATSQHTFGFFEQFGFKVTKIIPEGFGKEIDRYDMEFN